MPGHLPLEIWLDDLDALDEVSPDEGGHACRAATGDGDDLLAAAGVLGVLGGHKAGAEAQEVAGGGAVGEGAVQEGAARSGL